MMFFKKNIRSNFWTKLKKTDESKKLWRKNKIHPPPLFP
jgi:hypothetical protein